MKRLRYPQQLSKSNVDLMARAKANPFFNWRMQYLSKDMRHPSCEMHVDICETLTSVQQACMVAPRSFSKSTYASKDFPIYLCCEHAKLKAAYDAGNCPIFFPHHDITIASDTGPLAKKWLGLIKTELETNADIISNYGDLKGPIWNQDEIMTSNGVHIRAVGRGYQQRGWRPTLFICDDLDGDELPGDEQLQKLFDWWDGPVRNAMDEVYCQIFVIGTMLDEVSLLTYIADKDEYKKIHYGCYQKDDLGEMPEEPGNETWPSKWPHERLQSRLSEIGDRAFSAEFRGEPQPSENPIFERNWFIPYDSKGAMFEAEMEKGFHYTIVNIDPAISKKDKSDYSAIVTLSLVNHADKPRIYVRVGGVKQGHWSIGRQVTEVMKAYDQFYATEVAVEATAYQAALADEVEAYMDKTRRDIRVKRVFPDADKERRSHAVAPMIERGLVYVDLNDPETKHLVDQMVRFRPGMINLKKDKMDACVQGLGIIKKMIKSISQETKTKRVLPTGVRMNYTTGVRS